MSDDININGSKVVSEDNSGTLGEVSQAPKEQRKLCEVCIEDNLISKVGIIRCERCHESFCIHFASSIDPQSCCFCLHDVSVTVDTIHKTTEHYNEETDTVTTKTRKAKSIKLGGMHWLFVQRKIRDLSDAELEVAIEYHHAIHDGMILERDQRRIEHFHRNAGKKFVPPTSVTSGTETTETVITKKTRTTKIKTPNAPEINATAVLQSLLKSGMSLEQIAKMIAGKK